MEYGIQSVNSALAVYLDVLNKGRQLLVGMNLLSEEMENPFVEGEAWQLQCKAAELPALNWEELQSSSMKTGLSM
jgi:hypothetical protein